MLTLEMLFAKNAKQFEVMWRLRQEMPNLMDFNPRKDYSFETAEHTPMSYHFHRMQMGRAVALIRRMADQGASNEELARGIRYAFVICDALKHDLNWRKSLDDFGIRDLEKKYPRKPA